MEKHKLRVANMFCGCGGLDYDFHKNQSFKVVYANDFDKDSCISYENFYNFKPELKDIKEVLDIPDCDILTGGFPCFIAGTKVLTDEGYKNIENIQGYELLLTHTGKFQKILNLQRKLYKNNLYKIRAKYHPYPITCTDNHPFYVRERKRTWNDKIRRYEYYFEEPKWIKSKNLTMEHFFGFPINNQEIIPIIENIKLNKPNQWFMMGFWIGDGWVEKTPKKNGRYTNKIRFAINNDDEEYVLDRIRDILPITDKKCSTGKCKKFGCSNKTWFNILNNFGKYAHGKLIPEWVQNAPKHLIQEFINGYMKADGYLRKNGSYRITTVSSNLAFGLQRLYLKLGYIFSINYTKRPPTCVIEGRTVNQRDTYQIEGYLKTIKKQKSFIDTENNYAWFAPFTITNEPLEKEITVYNFEVEEDNSYIVENIVCHNCQGFSIANIYRNEEDERNELYKELVRLLKLKKPKYFIFENVKGILSLGGYDEPSKCSGINKNKTKCKSKSKFTNNTDSKINYCRKHYKNLTDEERKNYIEIKKEGKIFKTIIKELQDCGYNVHTKLFKMKWYDIPQNRERVIFLGIREDIGKNIIFKWPVENQVITKTLRDAIGDLPIEYNEEIQHIGTKHKVKITGYMGNRQLDWDKISPTITGRGSGGGGPVINVHPSQKRRMTVREYARIQTFPDEFMFNGAISSKYRQIGNAVPVKFSKILTKIILSIDNQL